jgi:ABC-type transport system involved in cytochrome c biogenesis permease subunit
MTQLEPQTPPTGEEVHLPGPTILPLLTAVGITIAVVGVTTSLILVIGGGVLTIACVARWIMDTRREVGELPLDHH